MSGTSARLSPTTIALALLMMAGILITTPLSAQQSLSGMIKYDGEPFRVRAIRMSADPKCEEVLDGKKVLSQDRVVAEDGALANVFVYLKDAPPGSESATPQEAVVLGQEGCMYTPRVQGIQVNQSLEIQNGDPTLHNVRCLAKKNRPFNIGQPPQVKEPRVKTFRATEKAVKFKCDVHPWMSGYLFVLDHPFYATSGTDGSFTISGVPKGKHTLVAWHEQFGEQELEIEVGDSSVADLSFIFPGD